MNTSKILYLFTRSPLHVGAGASIGAIDQPVQRERHTGYPIIPASSLKGSLVDHWDSDLDQPEGEKKLRLTTKAVNDKNVVDKISEAAWLFGSDNDKYSFSGCLQFGEAKLLAFPIRSARGSYAWITSLMILQRAARDGVISEDAIANIKEPDDDKGYFDASSKGVLNIDNKIILEEYTFENQGSTPDELVNQLTHCIHDPIWKDIQSRLVIVSNGIMSYFARTACDIAQHVRINDETGTAEDGALFNQENVPSETLFYAPINAFKSKAANSDYADKSPEDAMNAFSSVVTSDNHIFQFGGDATTGLGICSLNLIGKQKG